MPPALKTRNRWLSRALEKVVLSGGKAGIVAAALFFGFMLWFARPVFQVDISAMNSLSDETIAADKNDSGALGGSDEPGLYDDRGAERLGTSGEKRPPEPACSGRISGRASITSAFLALRPLSRGRGWRGRRAADWRAFWTPRRVADLDRELRQAGREMGFAPDAFKAFTDSLSASPPAAMRRFRSSSPVSWGSRRENPPGCRFRW